MTDIDYVKTALSYIDPNLPRDDWVNIGMALQYELGDNLGYDVFKNWSAGSPDFSARDFESTWKSFKQGYSSFTLGTIVFFAKAGGFDPKSIKLNVERSSADVARVHAEQRRAAEKQRFIQDKKAEAARKIAVYRWNSSKRPDADNIHPYLVKKGCSKPYGPIKQYKNFLQIPAFNKDGLLTTLLSINETGFKAVIKDSVLSGSSMTIGKNTGNQDKPILLCEGWATGQSLHAASRVLIPQSGLQVVVAFNSNNLIHVARNIRTHYLDRPIIVCADNDCCNRSNVGILKANDTLDEIQDNIVMIYPEFPQEMLQEKLIKAESVPSDFNDAHLIYGLESVSDYIKDGLVKLDLKRVVEQENINTWEL